MKRMSRNKRSAVKAGTPPAGEALEKVVARIQQLMDPTSRVTHNEQIVDRVGNTRQYDVVIRGQFGGRPVLGIIECKDHNRKMGPDVIEAFAKKTENLGANLRLMVSKRGFTEQALRLAKHEGIGCLSLLHSGPHEAGFSIGDMWYGVIARWIDITLTVHLPDRAPQLPSFDANALTYQGKHVFKWFLRELFTTYGEETTPGPMTLSMKFDEPRILDFGGVERLVVAITCGATRIFQKKRRWVSWTGDAFYDWHTSQLSVPNKASLVSSVIDSNLDTWPDYDGELPAGGAPGGIITATLMSSQKWPESDNDDVPDLSAL